MLYRVVGCAAFGAAAILAASASAGTLSVTKSNGDMIAGTGIPADNFTIATGANDEELGLKGRLRDTGQALSVDGNRYFVPTGLSGDAPGTPAWRFDWQYSPASGTSIDGLKIEIDFDPTAAENFFTLSGPIAGFWDMTDGYFTNPGSGAWSNDDVPFVYSQSWGLHYDFYSEAFNPWIAGEYTIRFTALAGQEDVFSTSIVVEAVPEPAALGLLGFGLIGLVAARRRKA